MKMNNNKTITNNVTDCDMTLSWLDLQSWGINYKLKIRMTRAHWMHSKHSPKFSCLCNYICKGHADPTLATDTQGWLSTRKSFQWVKWVIVGMKCHSLIHLVLTVIKEGKKANISRVFRQHCKPVWIWCWRRHSENQDNWRQQRESQSPISMSSCVSVDSHIACAGVSRQLPKQFSYQPSIDLLHL